MNSTARNLGITAAQITHAKQMITDGNGGDTVAYDLGLDKHYRRCEFDEVLASLGLEW